MIKRLLVVLALGAAFAACSPANSSSSPDVNNPTIEAPASAMPSVEASPSAS